MTRWPNPDDTKRPEDHHYMEPQIPHLTPSDGHVDVIRTINQIIDRVNALALKETSR